MPLFNFTSNGGKRRDWVIVHQTAANRRKGGWFAKSFAEPDLHELDLRIAKNIAHMEKTLAECDPEIFMMPTPTLTEEPTPEKPMDAKPVTKTKAVKK